MLTVVIASGSTAGIITNSELPDILKNIHKPPQQLYYKGDKNLLNKTCISVVGTRKFGEYGRYVTEKIIAEMASLDIVIVSGLARGIDTIAHEAALKNGLPTIAVLGSGIENIYPKENKKLAEKIEKYGLIISEYPDQTQPTKITFPTRNRIIAGLSIATIVTEAPIHSGALHTARIALDENREIFAVPGDIDRENSSGTNKLIKDSRAHAVTNINDIISELPLQISLFPKPSRKTKTNSDTSQIANQIIELKISEVEKEILEKIPLHRAAHMNAIIEKTNLPIPTILATLSALEMRGLISNSGGKYARSC